MNRKAKNRNKQNKPNPRPPQKNVSLVPKKISEDESLIEEKQSENVNEERVPEIVSENVIPENCNKELEKEIPKIPKRNKGKNKKQQEILQGNKYPDVVKDEKNDEKLQLQEDATTTTSLENLKIETVVDTDIVLVIENLLETQTPLASKVIQNEEIISTNNIVLDTLNVDNGEEQFKLDTESKQEIKSKKKNKRKKKRNDSERSDVVNSVDTQYLHCIRKMTSENEQTDTVHVDLSENRDVEKTATKPIINEIETQITKSISESLADSRHNTLEECKKRGKRPEKQSLQKEVMSNQICLSELAEAAPTITTEKNDDIEKKKSKEIKLEEGITRKEKNQKNKAKLAQPVGKNNNAKDEKNHEFFLKNISNIEATAEKETITFMPEMCIDNVDEITKIEAKLLTPNTQDFETNISGLLKDSDESVIIESILSEKGVYHISMENSDSEEKLKEPIKQCNVTSGLSLLDVIETSSIKPEEIEESVSGISPDIIEYPRSSSEYISDVNNNTIIEEILLTQDIKNNVVDIPIVTDFTEIIEELPGTSNTIETKVTEEKTDIKSKMIEVNQDIQELKLSMEKSLAELTDLEKSKENIENELIVRNQDIKSSKMEDTKTKLVNTDKLLTSNNTNMCNVKTEKSNIETKIKEGITQEKEENRVNIPPETELDRLKINTQPICPARKDKSKCNAKKTKENLEKKHSITTEMKTDAVELTQVPICPTRKDNKSKSKSRQKGKQEIHHHISATTSTALEHEAQVSQNTSETYTSQEKTQTKTTAENQSKSEEKGKQQHFSSEETNDYETQADPNTKLRIEDILQEDYEPIENFEDALSTSLDDVNKTFELIANEVNEPMDTSQNPEINIIAPDVEISVKNKEKINPVSQPKNLLGHPNIPVQSNKTDYKKERNKTPNTKLAKVNIKDTVGIDNEKKSKQSQTDNKRRSNDQVLKESVSYVTNGNEEYVYKYSFRKVFLPNACHVCKSELKRIRVPCSYCNLVFYYSQKHKNDDWSQHQALCFAVSTVAHLKGHKHIYADSKGIVGHNYRLLRMQMIISCEKVLKRKLSPCEQEALLYPRICINASCREWHQSKLKDCDGCGQVSYCSDSPDHLPKTHQRWCNSYGLYQKLVCHQQTKGKLEPKLPTRVMEENYRIPDKMNEVLASMYEEKIDMNDMQYAALTQLGTAPLTAAYSYQMSREQMNAININKTTNFTLHIVGVELQFEADVLNKWEVFFLHLQPNIEELRVVLISRNLNSCNLPLDILGKIQLCSNCTRQKRRLIFDFQDKNYFDYWTSDDYVDPHLVCAFNANIQRSSMHNGKDSWPSTINCVLKSKVPFVVTSYTLEELRRDAARIKECAYIDYRVLSEPKNNSFASVRPDRNFISDDEMPLLFKNYSYFVFHGVN